jgi:protein TonB
MHSLSGVSQPLPRQWLQSSFLHGVLLLCVVLYHLHSQGSLYVSTKSLNQLDTSTTTIGNQHGIDYLELTFEQDAMTEPQQADTTPSEIVRESVATEPARTKPTVQRVGPARPNRTSTQPTANSASAAHHVTTQPLQTARPDHAYSPKPAYPLALRDLGVSGVVWLRVWVDDVGRPREIELSKGSGYRLFDEAALRAVQHWRFIPAKNEQQNLASWVEFAVRFEING